MDTNDIPAVEDSDIVECDGEKVVTMVDVLQEQEDFEKDANAVLGASDEKNCTFSKGYIKRQAIYACMTCCIEAKEDPSKRAGICLACSLICHENHDLIELYTKRNFRCDCGNPKFNCHPCQFTSNKEDLNESNNYNQNFSGLYCICHRPYPDPEASVDDEMIQCIICEDWLHASHLEATLPANDQYSEMICKSCMDKNPFLHNYSHLAINIENEMLDVLSTTNVNNGSDLEASHDGKNESDKIYDQSEPNTSVPNAVKANEMDASSKVENTNELRSLNVTDIKSVDVLNKVNDQNSEVSAKNELTDTFNNKQQTQDTDFNSEVIKTIDPEKNEEDRLLADPDDDDLSNSKDNNPINNNSYKDSNDDNKANDPNAKKNTEHGTLIEKDTQAEQNQSVNVGGDSNIPQEDINKDPKVVLEEKEDLTMEVDQHLEDHTSANEYLVNKSNTLCNDSNSKDKNEQCTTHKEIQPTETMTNEENKNNGISSDNNIIAISIQKTNDSDNNTSEHKRKLPLEGNENTLETSEIDVKRPKLECSCVQPQSNKKVIMGAAFWPSDFRQKLCTCGDCLTMYRDLSVLFLTDIEDTVSAYENLGEEKERMEGKPASQYEKGLQALSSLDRVQQINALTEYNKMRDKLLEFLKSFKDRREVVKEEDIKEFFAGMKPKREPDGVYFCK